jgi:hypothetical protein
MSPGEIHLAMFPFGGVVGAKPRPVLLLTGPLGSVPEVLVAHMTSVVPATLLPTDILIDPKQSQHSGTNLKQVNAPPQCWHKLALAATLMHLPDKEAAAMQQVQPLIPYTLAPSHRLRRRRKGIR